MDDALRACLACAERAARGELSAPLALMEMLIASEDLALVERALAQDSARYQALQHTLTEHRGGCARIVEQLRQERVEGAEHSVAESLAFSQALFDGLVKSDEETSVALYSLGSPEILAMASAEIVAWLRACGLLRANTRVLDFGCGIGRMIGALAPHVGFIEGVDLSEGMVAAAQRRTAALANARVRTIDGRDLRAFAAASHELVLAVDSFPYLVRAGAPLVDAMFAEIARVLVPGGHFALLNFSYRGEPARDLDEVRALAARHRFTGERMGERPFAIWNGVAFLLRGR